MNVAQHRGTEQGPAEETGVSTLGRGPWFVPGTAVDEATRAFRNVVTALAVAGFATADIVYLHIAFLDLADAPATAGVAGYVMVRVVLCRSGKG